MSLKQSNTNKIPKRNQYLTYGYVRECEKKIQNMQNIPVMIKHLFLIFWNINRDAFDKQQTHSKINVKDSIEAKLHTDEDDDVVGDNVNSYMENVASSGTHIWRFHLSQVNVFDMIGISRVQSGQRKDKSFTGAIDTDDDYAFRCPNSKLHCESIPSSENVPWRLSPDSWPQPGPKMAVL